MKVLMKVLLDGLAILKEWRMIGFLKEYMWESVSVVAWYFDCRRGALIQ